jgi:hypothetical protein
MRDANPDVHAESDVRCAAMWMCAPFPWITPTVCGQVADSLTDFRVAVNDERRVASGEARTGRVLGRGFPPGGRSVRAVDDGGSLAGSRL